LLSSKKERSVQMRCYLSEDDEIFEMMIKYCNLIKKQKRNSELGMNMIPGPKGLVSYENRRRWIPKK
jgi:hypothetical protein